MTDQSSKRDPKVARLIDKYGIQDIGAELENLWTRKEDRFSLRDLAQYFNRSLLETELRKNGSDHLVEEIDRFYESLIDDNVTSGQRQQARSELRQTGIDISELEEDFVSYQAIRTYLHNYRNVDTPKDTAGPKERRQKKKTTIQQLQSRLNTVTSDALMELKNAENISIGEFNVIVTVNVHCSDCGSRISVAELLSHGHCDCVESK